MAYKKETYTMPSQYSEGINNLVKQVNNQQDFSYNPLEDSVYQSYANQYARLGQQANENTLANVATNTGGLASSYAVTAAAQAQNQYNQALADKIPELEQLAYERYNANRNYNLDALSALSALLQNDFNMFDANRNYNRSIYESDRDYARSVKESDREFKENKRQFNKGYKLDKKNYKLSAKQQKIDKALDIWATKGVATAYVAKVLGVKKGSKTSSETYQRWQMKHSK